MKPNIVQDYDSLKELSNLGKNMTYDLFMKIKIGDFNRVKISKNVVNQLALKGYLNDELDAHVLRDIKKECNVLLLSKYNDDVKNVLIFDRVIKIMTNNKIRNDCIIKGLIESNKFHELFDFNISSALSLLELLIN